ncbi:sensor domain-containing protein [Actinoplanes sp. NPDC024001]|uniref:sensor histidine kinase n=1 Tax=Actinoplanes sp. NPDC024001 TaxID=3154598 RepID=UPI0033D9751D
MDRDISQVLKDRAVTAVRGLLIAVLSLSANITLFALMVTATALIPVLGIGIVALPLVVVAVRWRAELERRLAGWSGVHIATPYHPIPQNAPLGSWRRFRAVVSDPATWRDFAWLLPGAIISGVLGILAFALPVYGLEGALFVPVLLYGVLDWYGYGATWPLDDLPTALSTVPQGLFLLLVGLVAGPFLLRAGFHFGRLLLAPTAASALRQRVATLTTSRADTVDAQAAELRRIERDLHDGAQARLVSLGMNIGLAEALLHRNPDAAEKLLAEAREASGQALGELRQVVRGILPPVLAERGLGGAVSALALTVAVPVEVDVDIPGRLPAPVESAAYFCVAEMLANIVKHSGARQARVGIRHHDGLLSIRVTDDGAGGADPEGGSGLRGVQRRLAAFDGTMTVTSPRGGPTVVTMELPCALSSPKISPSSATD